MTQPPSRMHVVGRWRGRFHRAVGTAKSLLAMIGVWRRMSRHDRMFLLSWWEGMSDADRRTFAANVGSSLPRAWMILPRTVEEYALAILDQVPSAPPDPGDELEPPS
jgi:hypothetical protein